MPLISPLMSVPRQCSLLPSSSSGGTLEEQSHFHDVSPGRPICCSPQCRV